MITWVWWVAAPIAIALLCGWGFLEGWSDPKRVLAIAPPGAAAIWILYGFWETRVVQPEDNIRVDLVLLGPPVIALTVLGVVAIATLPRRRKDARS